MWKECKNDPYNVPRNNIKAYEWINHEIILSGVYNNNFEWCIFFKWRKEEGGCGEYWKIKMWGKQKWKQVYRTKWWSS